MRKRRFTEEQIIGMLRKDGRRRLYALDPDGLLPVRRWLGGYERFWGESFARFGDYAKELEPSEEEDE